jgi:hypothetical protein
MSDEKDNSLSLIGETITQAYMSEGTSLSRITFRCESGKVVVVTFKATHDFEDEITRLYSDTIVIP